MSEHRACDLDDLPIGELLGLRLREYDLVLLNAQGDIRAYYGFCPHALGRLSEADFDGEELVCGAHLWSFDARTGAGVNPEDACLTPFPVEVRDGAIWVEIPDIPLSDWRRTGFRRSA